MEFLIAIPSIRQNYPGFDDVIGRIRATLTPGSQLHLLDGVAGKAQTLNRFLTEVVPESRADVYITMDDDFLPTSGWLEKLEAAFRRLPDYGAFGLWLGDSPEMLAYMGERSISPCVEVGGIALRTVMPGHHIVGCLVAMRREVALAVGTTPDTDERYQFWEDGWRGRRVTKLGFRQGFIEAGDVEFVRWQDTEEYLDRKQRDIEAGEKKLQTYMKQGGVQDPLHVRLRQAVRRWRRKG